MYYAQARSDASLPPRGGALYTRSPRPPVQHAYAGDHNGSYAATADELVPYVADPAIVDGTCTGGASPSFVLWAPGHFNATIPPNRAGTASLGAGITDDRYMTVFPWQ